MKKFLSIFLFTFFLKGIAMAQCNAGFGYTVSANTVIFTATDSLAYGSTWFFGDGSLGYGTNASHSYSVSGAYTVIHVVTDTIRNCSDSSKQTINLSFNPSCAAFFGYSRDSINLGNYYFYDESNIIGSTFSNAQWSVNGTLAQGSGASFSYQFPHTGQYQVCEMIQTSSGCTSNYCQQIQVYSLDSCNLNAQFTYAASPLNPLSIAFTAAADPTGPVVYNWFFGDGTTDTTRNPVHIYTKGVYMASLQKTLQTDSLSPCSAIYGDTVYVNIGPMDTCSVSFTYTPNSTEPNLFSFAPVSSQPIASALWTFVVGNDSGSSVTSLLNNPVYQFTGPGPYFVNLKIITQSGCIANAYQQIAHTDSSSADSMVANAVPPLITYPNPASSAIHLHVALPTANPITVSIYSSMGSLLIKKQTPGSSGDNPISIPVENLQPGVYFMEISYGNSVKFSRFQKL